MYEPRHQLPLTRRHFARRLASHAFAALALIVVSLLIGMAGYAYFENLSCLDAFLNTAMLLGGMGPVNPIQSDSGKLFAGCYALFAGMVVLATTAIMFTPVLHRLLHKFHWDQED